MKVTDPLYFPNSVSFSIWLSSNKFTGYLIVLLVFNGKFLLHWFINGGTIPVLVLRMQLQGNLIMHNLHGLMVIIWPALLQCCMKCPWGGCN